MRIRVRLFAMQRAQTGQRSWDLELVEGASVEAAWSALVAEFPVLAPATASVRFARNGAYVDLAERLAPGDELAVIPPVSGGSGDPGGSVDPLGADDPVGSVDHAGCPEPHRRLELTERPLDDGLLAELRREVGTPADGAITMFIGQTRTTPGSPAPGQEAEAARFAGRRVSGLSYEAFEPMALAVLDEIAGEMESRFGVSRLAIVHRLGDVAVGEASVVIAVASPHREEAFSACRYAIEELKARAPIWKAERFADGSVWIGAPARPGPDMDPGSGPAPRGPDHVSESG